jgi:uncharacterized membrane protein
MILAVTGANVQAIEFPVLIMIALAVWWIFRALSGTRSVRGEQQICRACGASHPNFARFCRRCGRQL